MIYPAVLILGLTGLVFIVAGAIMFKYPPKAINNWYGYRTKRSKLSQEAWDFSQTYAAKQMMGVGVCMTVLAVVRWFLPYNESWELMETLGAVVLMILLSFIIIIKTENRLKNA